jgi:DNA polymerase alpha subunit B N-terminal
MADCWMAFSANKNITSLKVASMDLYKDFLEKHSKDSGPVVSRADTSNKRELSPSTPPPAAKRTESATRRVSPNQESTSSVVNKASAITPIALFHEREGAGKVVFTYDPNNLPQPAAPSTKAPRCTVYYDYDTNVKEPYQHAFTVLEERSKALNEHLLDLGEAMTEVYGLDKEPENEDMVALEAVGTPRQNKVCCIGRICNSVSTDMVTTMMILYLFLRACVFSCSHAVLYMRYNIH